MSAFKLRTLRTVEGPAESRQVGRMSWEELESRVFLSRAVATIPVSRDVETEPIHDEPTQLAIIDRSIMDSTDAAIELSRVETTDPPAHRSPSVDTQSTKSDDSEVANTLPDSDRSNRDAPKDPERTPPSSTEPTVEPQPSDDVAPSAREPTTYNRTGGAAAEPIPTRSAVEPAPTTRTTTTSTADRQTTITSFSNDSAPSQKSDEPATPVESPARPVSAANQDLEPRKPVAGSADKPTATETPTSTGDSVPDCTPHRTDRRSDPDCASHQPQAIVAMPDEAATTPENSTERNNATQQPLVVDDTANPGASSSPSQEAPVQHPSGPPTHDQSTVSAPETTTENHAHEPSSVAHAELPKSEVAPNVLTAGVFAVALTRPLSRLGAGSNSLFADPATCLAVPLHIPRRRRRQSGTADGRDEREEDPEAGTSYGPSVSPSGIEITSRRSRCDARDRYEPYEAAIFSLVDSTEDKQSEAARSEWFSIGSIKSFAAGALTTACAFLTLQGVRRPSAKRPQLRPARPSYLGTTIQTAN